jgi:predicted enzyme related to lactoylglutathione lyase
MQKQAVESLVQAKVDVFLCVRDIRQAMNMYSKLFNLPIKEESFYSGHLYCMDNGILLDSDEMEGRPIPDWLPVSLKLSSLDIDKAKEYVEEIGFKVPSPIERYPTVSWFLFKDPDGNTLMMCAPASGE